MENDCFKASVIMTIIMIVMIFGGCLFIRHIRGDDSYASVHNISKITITKNDSKPK